MNSNFTPENITNVAFEKNSLSEVENLRSLQVDTEPSDSVIRQLLNYSRSLIAVESKITSKTSLLLLN
ncbi:MAG: hypothetical protein FD170_3112 [Bacteroidetes bacterium]|nr:MAG: hypothetical protein FD170_3112 [Bacteroidota bacterium]